VASGDVLRFVPLRLARKTVSMEALEERTYAIARASLEIRTFVQSLAVCARAARNTADASFEMKSDAAEST
jgi:hypothetical protein